MSPDGHGSDAPLVVLERVSKTFPGPGGRLVHAVRDVSFALHPGESVGVVGESGCGKTTLSRLIVRLEEPTDGRILLMGRDVTRAPEREVRPLRREVQVVFQDPQGSLNPRMRVGTIISEPLRAFGVAPAECRRRVRELLDVVGMPQDAAERFPHAFSGGQRQRIGIARALALSPKLLVCDEAVSALDVSVQAQILNLLAEVRERFGLSLLFISHNLAVVRHLCRRVVVMHEGQLVELADENALFDHPLHPYTHDLLDAVLEPVYPPRDLPRARDLSTLSSRERSKGCAYRSRCARAAEPCDVPPELVEWRPGHWARCHFGDEPSARIRP